MYNVKKIIPTSSSKNLTCPARVVLKEVIKFPDYKIESNTNYEKKKWSKMIRDDMCYGNIRPERRIYYHLPPSDLHLHTVLTKLGKAVVYTDSLSSLYLLLSRHPRSSTSLVHTIQTALHLTNEGWEIAFQCVPSHAGIRGNEVADSAARMALTDVNTTPFPLPLSAAKRLIPRVCRSTWNNTLGDALRITSMGQYRSDSSPQPWIRKKSRVLDVTLTRLRLGHTTLTAHLHRLRLSPDPHCPWCMNFLETIEHFLLQCPHFHSHRVVLQSQLLALNVTTFDLPTLLAAAGVPPSRQHAVIRLTCAFLRKTGQLPRL
ncbi:hypothetical protein GWK47_014121 [Chionoecetes opilio]|uniref:RNase H type-1 domain-containing protein n=1 Tax=Chionoecetes opilio TaxID=41210 RepID=A0A8J4XYK5_CHIOP|nr:hypothetical protein GWK47_014121 [Chionoecetes opilio]